MLDTFASNVADIKSQNPDIDDDEYVAQTTERNWQQAEGRGFIYGYNVSASQGTECYASRLKADDGAQIAKVWAQREAEEEDKLSKLVPDPAATVVAA